MSDCKPVLSPTSLRRATVPDSPSYHYIHSSMARPSTEFRPYFIPRRRQTLEHEQDVNNSPALRTLSPMHHSQPSTPALSWGTAGSSPDTGLSQLRSSPQDSDIQNDFHFQATNSPFSMSVSLPSISASRPEQPRIPPLDSDLEPLLGMSHSPDVKDLLERIRELEYMLRARTEESQWDRTQSQNLNPIPGMFPSQMIYRPNPNVTNASEALGTPPPDWERRTQARVRRFCGLNRAGNALCAWHDSRRERRMYPPRMAPQNTLNCGCTYAEALFEESLARNHVGSYLPGESVRMDPVLRNALLKLLQDVYGYQDGDFERLQNGTWKDGEDAASWEHKATMKPPRRESR